jgi:outer membrane lipoprotein-sorting protein
MKPARLLSLTLGLAWAGSALPAWALPLSPEGIMQAREHLNFQGTLLVTEGAKRQRIRVTQGEGRRQREEFLGPQGEVQDLVVSDGQVRWHHAPSRREVRVAQVAPEGGLQQRIALLKANYKFQVQGQLRHLGRLVLLTQFVPRHAGNLTHRLWVDQQTQLPLVVERRDPAGALVDRSEFTQIAFDPPLTGKPFLFQLPDGCKVGSNTTVLAQGDGWTAPPRGLAWRPEPPKDLPEGYRLIHWQYFLDPKGVKTFAWRFHDGLNLVSCFATDARSLPPAPAGAVAIGGGTGYEVAHGAKHLLAWPAGPTGYTLIGHLPAEQLRQVAASTR